ncbi:hypothetical protein [Stutzerimonas marianensis]
MNNSQKLDPIEDYRNIQREVREREKYLNSNIGYFGFTFAIASLGTSVPQFWALLSMLFIVVGHVIEKKEKISTLRRVSALKKSEQGSYYAFLEEEIRKSISVKRSAPFVIGYVVLFLIIFLPAIIPHPEILNFIYGDRPYFDIWTFSFVQPG